MNTKQEIVFWGFRTIYQDDLVSSEGYSQVKGQSQEGKAKGSMWEWEGLGATEKQTAYTLYHCTTSGTDPQESVVGWMQLY